MPHEFKLPDLGEGLAQATIVKWYVKPGDTLTPETPCLAVETAKSLVDIPSPSHGTLIKRAVTAGQTIGTGAVLFTYHDQNHIKQEPLSSPQKSHDQPTTPKSPPPKLAEKSSQTSQPSVKRQQQVPASAVTRHLAGQFKIDLSTIKGTGPQGQILIKDLPLTQTNTFLPDPKLASPTQQMAFQMKASYQQKVPTTVTDWLDVDHLTDSPSFTALIIQVLAKTLKAHPHFNAHYVPHQRYQICPDIHLGIAMDTQYGLFMPVIENLNDQDTASIQKNLTNLKLQAQGGSLPPSSTEPTFVFSNFGSLGAGVFATPMLIAPSVATLAIGQTTIKPHWDQSQWQPRTYLPISLTFDHQVLTGGQACRFIKTFKENAKKPEK
jgi:pyruvate dehydrogenase E2 component (dihydrolipoamide acetyltransferase)